jgi:2-(1,2-epoxy-1,2-dihydrophenyl)acetyl-CoA isomerase
MEMTVEFQSITLKVEDGIALLTLNRPDILNSLNLMLAREVRAALAEVKERPDVRALILTGAGRGFCAGAQLSEETGEESTGQRGSRAMKEDFNPLILDLIELPVPVVAAVNGVAAGAGASIALAADVVVAAQPAYFVLPFAPRLGIVPDLGATWTLPRLIGRARAHALTLLGDRLPAPTAAEWGLIWKCVPAESLMGEALALARRLGAGPRHIVGEVRQAFDAAEANDLPAQLEYERLRQEVLLDKEEYVEGVRAFLEKREPVFGRP